MNQSGKALTALVLASVMLIAGVALADDAKDIKEGVAQENGSTEFKLGQKYYKGEGVPRDYKKAFEWYEKSAEINDKKAQYKLALMYYKGQGTKQNY